ncbi:ferritin-like domain-containing protein [Irpex rosettiformis]|uniref:Ferritin-like domain-containing protein n=1 Tax=Irpex rosettiformis TaxID=378272 RepID=A0ACB8U2Q0_9APHY|nr:ferritin-like domain-containing protein [Irpex rosettiformis]
MYASLLFAFGALGASALPNLAVWNGTSPSNCSSSSSSSVNDTQILQFALTLENLENAFYMEGLSKFNDSAFQSAGFAPVIRERYLQIMQHERTHVAFLSAILGNWSTQPCNYTFPLNTVQDFVTTSFALESAGQAAYLGAGSLLQNKSLIPVTGSILSVEGRQASWISSAALNATPWNGPFDTPINASDIFSLASPFITTCPSTNPPLIVTPLNTLTLTPANATAGSNVTVQVGGPDFNSSSIPIISSATPAAAPALGGNFLAYFHGLGVSFSPIAQDNTTSVPTGLQGLVFASVVSTNSSVPSANTTLSGLAPLNIGVQPTADNSLN